MSQKVEGGSPKLNGERQEARAREGKRAIESGQKHLAPYALPLTPNELKQADKVIRKSVK